MATLTYQTISIYIWYFVSEVAIGIANLLNKLEISTTCSF